MLLPERCSVRNIAAVAALARAWLVRSPERGWCVLHRLATVATTALQQVFLRLQMSVSEVKWSRRLERVETAESGGDRNSPNRPVSGSSPHRSMSSGLCRPTKPKHRKDSRRVLQSPVNLNHTFTDQDTSLSEQGQAIESRSHHKMTTAEGPGKD